MIKILLKEPTTKQNKTMRQQTNWIKYLNQVFEDNVYITNGVRTIREKVRIDETQQRN